MLAPARSCGNSQATHSSRFALPSSAPATRLPRPPVTRCGQRPAEPKRKPVDVVYPPPLNGIAFRPDARKLLMLFNGPVDEPAPKKAPDLKQVFKDACSKVLALEPRYPLLRGIGLAKPPPAALT